MLVYVAVRMTLIAVVLAYVLWVTECPKGVTIAPLTFVIGWAIATMYDQRRQRGGN